HGGIGGRDARGGGVPLPPSEQVEIIGIAGKLHLGVRDLLSEAGQAARIIAFQGSPQVPVDVGGARGVEGEAGAEVGVVLSSGNDVGKVYPPQVAEVHGVLAHQLQIGVGGDEPFIRIDENRRV